MNLAFLPLAITMNAGPQIMSAIIFAVVPSEEAAAGLEALYETGCDAWRIGEVTEAGGVEFV